MAEEDAAAATWARRRAAFSGLGSDAMTATPGELSFREKLHATGALAKAFDLKVPGLCRRRVSGL